MAYDVLFKIRGIEFADRESKESAAKHFSVGKIYCVQNTTQPRLEPCLI